MTTLASARPKPRTLNFSLSAYQAWQRCEERYYLQYVRRLRRRDKPVAPTLGIVFHDYLNAFYNGLKLEVTPDEAHLNALVYITQKHLPTIRGYANVAFAAGQEDLARELREIPERAGRLANLYFETRGKADAERYEVLYVELPMEMRLAPGIKTRGRIDLITRDRETERTNLWEHKTTGSVPPDGIRLRDFQTPLYVRCIEERIPIDSVVWNYVRTKEPVIPDLVYRGTKRESLTRRSDLDSTWNVYRSEIDRLGLSPDDYEDVRERLEGREYTVFLPRYEKVIVTDIDVLMEDYITEARRARKAEFEWATGRSRPVRTLARDCDSCEYLLICQAAIMGGDSEDVIRFRYTTGKEGSVD